MWSGVSAGVVLAVFAGVVAANVGDCALGNDSLPLHGVLVSDDNSPPACFGGGVLESDQRCSYQLYSNSTCTKNFDCVDGVLETSLWNCTATTDDDDEVPYGGIGVLLVIVPCLCVSGALLLDRVRERKRVAELDEA